MGGVDLPLEWVFQPHPLNLKGDDLRHLGVSQQERRFSFWFPFETTKNIISSSGTSHALRTKLWRSQCEEELSWEELRLVYAPD